jgi:CheY-like chemotaxis protein
MAPPDEGRPLEIVLAEDNPDLAVLNERVLEAEGHHVQVTGDGDSTLRVVRETDPDLLLLDMDMPLRDGMAVVEELRADPRTADQAVVVMSNKELSDSEERDLMRLGVIDFLAKWKVGPLVLADWIRRWTAGEVRRFAVHGKRL